MHMLFYSMLTEKFQEIQKKFLYYKYESMQDCSKIVTLLYIFSARYSWKYRQRFHYRPLEAEHKRATKKPFLAPKGYDEHPPPGILG